MPRGRAADPVQRLREICLALPEVSERSSHGEPTWFVRNTKTVASLDDHHHGSDHLAFWCPAPPGVQREMIEQEPQRFFCPPYVGGRGWLGVRIDNDPDWDAIARIIEDAYRMVAPKKLIALLDD
ncbi:MAG: MmcQ/YjbR family DNA-binding protein [Acidimicrobiales bacterium]